MTPPFYPFSMPSEDKVSWFVVSLNLRLSRNKIEWQLVKEPFLVLNPLNQHFFVMSSPRLLVPLRLLSNRAGGGLHQRCQIVSAIGVANLKTTITQQPHKRNFSSTSSKYKFWGPLWPLDPDGYHVTNNAILVVHNSSSKNLFST